MNPWNTTFQLKFDDHHKKEILNYKNIIFSARGKKRRELLEITPIPVDSVEYLKKLYFEKGYGLKIIARSLGLSYTIIRTLFQYLDIEIRKGMNVCTEHLKKIRSERIRGNKNPFYDWPVNKPELHSKTRTGIQGYFEKEKNEFIWLRSSWEYIYAKWLNKRKIRWSYESERYSLSDGTTYRPDFFIHNEQNEIIYIVEIKGYYDNRSYKVDLFKKEYPDISIIMISDIKKYCENYNKELEEWKSIRKSKSEL